MLINLRNCGCIWGKNFNVMFLRSINAWEEQLSTYKSTFRFPNLASHRLRYSSKRNEVIHAFLLAVYWIASGSIRFLKQRGLSDFPITSRGIFSVPVILAPNKTVIRSFDFFPSVHFSSKI